MSEIVGVVNKISNKNNSLLIASLKDRKEEWVDLGNLNKDSRKFSIGDVVLVKKERRKVVDVEVLYSTGAKAESKAVERSPEEMLFECISKMQDVYNYMQDKAFRDKLDWTKLVITLFIAKKENGKFFK